MDVMIPALGRISLVGTPPRGTMPLRVCLAMPTHSAPLRPSSSTRAPRRAIGRHGTGGRSETNPYTRHRLSNRTHSKGPACRFACSSRLNLSSYFYRAQCKREHCSQTVDGPEGCVSPPLDRGARRRSATPIASTDDWFLTPSPSVLTSPRNFVVHHVHRDAACTHENVLLLLLLLVPPP